MHKGLIGLFMGLLVGGGLVLWGSHLGRGAALPVLPTSAVLPSDTPTVTVSATLFLSPTSSPTTTPSATPTATITPTLTTRLLHITVPTLAPTAKATTTPAFTATLFLATVALPSPPADIPLVATAALPGWARYETDDPAFQYTVGQWLPIRTARASGSSYMYSADRNAVAVFSFEGAGLRLRYVGFPLYGVFELYLDGQLLTVIDGYRPRAALLTTELFSFPQGAHTLTILNTGRKQAASGGYILALDSLDVYQGLPPTSTPTSLPSPTMMATPSPVLVQDLKLVSGPPTLRATVTLPPPSVVTASLVIAYDENGNKAVDPAEGVLGIAVRLVKISTNEVVASGFTNSEGFVQLQTVADAPMRLVVPYFGKFWDVSTGAAPRFTLLLPPGNQPGLIP